jgi:septum formation protein
MDPILSQKFGKRKIILASRSPRRHRLLKELGLDFDIQVVDVEEVYPDGLKREQIPVYLAKLKAEAFPALGISDDQLVITADTIVWLNDAVLQKPVDRDDAVRILNELSGNMHEVYSGVCLKSKDKTSSFYACSEVYFRELKKEEIEYYVDTYKPFDKAGAYGIQEWIGYVGIEKITGSFFNVMGLPTQKLYDELLKF